MRLRLHRLELNHDGCIGTCSVGTADRAHPNKMPFKGVLLLLNQPSDKPPHGAEGHRIYVPSAVARKRLPTLLNMGVNYTQSLDSHAPQHKVGVITGAQIDGNKVLFNGFLWQRDFPHMKTDLEAGRLGCSMELQDVSVRDKNPANGIWYLEDFHFSGATILYKSAAAYTGTSLSAAATVKKLSEVWGNLVEREIRKLALAAAAATQYDLEGGRTMKPNTKKTADAGQGEQLVQAIAAGVGPALEKAIEKSLVPFIGILEKQEKTIARMAASVEETKALSLEAAKHEDDDEDDMSAKSEDDDEMDAKSEEDDDEDDMSAAKKKSEEDDDEEDDSDDEELDAEMENLEDDTSEEDEPGELNKDAENQGDKTTRTGKVGKAKSMAVKASAKRIQASSVIRELYASHRALRKKLKTVRARAEHRTQSLQNKVEALEAQVERYAERTDRRSVSAELGNFLAKNNVDVRELRAEGRKLSVAEVDNIFASAPVELDPTTRMWFKNQLTAAELMEQGEVHRGLN
jgi:hypothetical protein